MKGSILAIDESKAIRGLLRCLLEKKYQVTAASDGCSALSWLSQKELPDIIITDLSLPDMADWELIDYIKSSGFYIHIPIIVLTAMPAGDTVSKCRKHHIRELFQMPFNPVELSDLIDDIIREKHANPPLAKPGGRPAGKAKKHGVNLN